MLKNINGYSQYTQFEYYSAINSSMMVQADLATGLPGPKIAATPAL